MRRIRVLTLIAVGGLGVGVSAAMFEAAYGRSTSRTFVELVRGAFAIKTADAAAPSQMTREQAETLARAATAEHLIATLGDRAAAGVRPLRQDDLKVADGTFAPAALEVAPTVGHFAYTVRGGTGQNLWVFIFRSEGLTMPDWGISNGVVEAQVAVNDRTGKIEAADVARINPSKVP